MRRQSNRSSEEGKEREGGERRNIGFVVCRDGIAVLISAKLLFGLKSQSASDAANQEFAWNALR